MGKKSVEMKSKFRSKTLGRHAHPAKSARGRSGDVRSTGNQKELINEYAGYEALPGISIPSISNESISPKEFWELYVSQRKPVLIKGHLKDPSWKASKLWTDDYLIANAGEAELLVEHRGVEEKFGKGRKVQMSFGDMVQRVSAGDESYYLTTQEVGYQKASGLPELCAAPVRQLVRDLPLQPSLLGSLIPHQINLWMGASKDGSSTGLHHDHHDNLYVLLRGGKQFRLYPPSLAPRMHTFGKVARVFPNGRIVYHGQVSTRADGAEERRVRAWEVDGAFLRATAGKGDNDEGNEGTREDAEEEAEDLLEASLEQALMDEEGMEFDDFDDIEDMMESDDDDDGDKKRDLSAPDKKNGNGVLQVDESDFNPENFSRVDLSLPETSLRKQFPDFPGVKAASVCMVEAGDMLYLPTGWFHEVTSFSKADGPSGSSVGAHLALNYWMHPPDNLDPSTAGFKAPYRSPYWEDMWKSANKHAHLNAGSTYMSDSSTVDLCESRFDDEQKHTMSDSTPNKSTLTQNGTTGFVKKKSRSSRLKRKRQFRTWMLLNMFRGRIDAYGFLSMFGQRRGKI